MARKELEAASEYLGAEKTREIGEIGQHEIEVVDRVAPADAMALEAFMNEPVTIMVHESTEEDEPDLVLVGVNGVTQYLKRGDAQTVKRKYVEVLARAKLTDYKQNLDPQLGELMNRLKQRHALKYPFSVIEDRNPKGGAWLKSILAEAR